MLEIRDVEAGYGRTPVLHAISLTVQPREIVSLIGSNGAGKSTTLKTISGLLRTRRGTIRFADRILSELPPHSVVRAGISHVPEGRRLFADMTVHENLVLGAYTCPPGDLAGRLADVYGFFPRLRERSTQPAGSLSGGEQQMVAIGRGLMAKPALLMLDEPSMGLAPKLVAQVADIVRSIREMGIGVLLVEQNARLALDISDRAYLLQMGAVVKEGTSAALRDDPLVRRTYLGR